jgi:hypothetical protein
MSESGPGAPELLQDTRPLGLIAGRAGMTADLCRGISRHLADLGWAPQAEVPLANGRRADLMALDRAGRVLIVEIKSSLEDFRVDAKWPDYLDFCDLFYFAVGASFPQEVLPPDHGLMVGDRYGGAILREAVERPLPAARRKALTLRLARLGAERLRRLADPESRVQDFGI